MAGSVSVWGALLFCVVVCFSLNAPVGAANGLRLGFYHKSCPKVEDIVFRELHSAYKKDQRIAPQVLRLAFHDCFVRGCECSILLDGPGTEQQSGANTFTNQTYAILASVKKAVEKACPGVVSCADVIQYAARDAVILTGGHGWAVPAGRRDGCYSNATDIFTNLPPPSFNNSQLVDLFNRKGLTTQQLVALSGAHTIGKAHCFTFDNRIQTPKPDPTLNRKLERKLKRECPKPGLQTEVYMDKTPHRFDTGYFHGLVKGRGLFTSDQSLIDADRTRSSVYQYLNPSKFSRDFASAMVAMSQIGVLTGDQGQIRRLMNVVNPGSQNTESCR